MRPVDHGCEARWPKANQVNGGPCGLRNSSSVVIIQMDKEPRCGIDKLLVFIAVLHTVARIRDVVRLHCCPNATTHTSQQHSLNLPNLPGLCAGNFASNKPPLLVSPAGTASFIVCRLNPHCCTTPRSRHGVTPCKPDKRSLLRTLPPDPSNAP